VKVGLVNIPLTYPPDKVDGFIISGIPVPSRSKDFAYPPTVLSKLDTYHVDLDGLMVQNEWRGKKLVKENRELFLRNVFNLSRNRTKNVLTLMKTEPWDFFMVVFTGPDRICHFFWKDHGNDKSPSLVVEEYYHFLDSMIGKLFNEAGEETIKLVISDHGFGPAPTKRINTFVLARLLDVDGHGWHPWPTCLKKALLAKIGLGKRPTMEDLVDPEKCRVLIKPMYANFLGISINSKYDNEAQITTGDDNSATLQELIINKLEGLTDPISGERIVERIATRESLYQGPYAERAPDLVVQLSYDYRPGFSPLRKRLVYYDVGDRIQSGEHRLEGLLIAGGPPIKSGRLARDLFIQDVTPTILYLLNTPIPETYDGRLITELFTENYITTNKPRYQTVEPQAEVPTDEPDDRDQGEFEESKKLLKNLGYL